jgi:predicted nucleic-acid-binding Zn-ribbon protein
MRHTLTCPKCSSRKLFYIEQIRYSIGDRQCQPLPVTSDWTKAAGSWFPSQTDAGFFEAWVCAQCGFTEWYAREALEALHEMAKRYGATDKPQSAVRFVDAEVDKGPFR